MSIKIQPTHLGTHIYVSTVPASQTDSTPVGFKVNDFLTGAFWCVPAALLKQIALSTFVCGVVFFFFTHIAYAGSCSSATSAAWNATSTWTVGCGTGGTAQVPTAADDVTILDSHTVTIATGVNASATAVTINSGGILTITSTGGLTASGNFVNNGTATGTGALNLTGSGTTISGTGSFVGLTGATTITNSKTISSTSTLSFGGAVAISSGSTTNNGSTTVAGNLTGTGSWIQGANSTLNAGGGTTNAMAVTTTDFTATGNTVNYNRAGTQTCKVTQYYNLTMSGTSAKTCALTSAVLGEVRLQGTATWTMTTAFDITGQLFIEGGTLTTGGVAFNVTGTTTVASGTLTFTNNTALKKSSHDL